MREEGKKNGWINGERGGYKEEEAEKGWMVKLKRRDNGKDIIGKKNSSRRKENQGKTRIKEIRTER